MTPDERKELKQEIIDEGQMSDQDKAAYSEASQWVRLTNTVSWTLLIAAVPILVGLLAGAAATSASISKWILAGGSAFLAAVWFYVDYLYEKSTVGARMVLVAIEEANRFAHQFYTGQQKEVPRVHSLNLLVMAFLAVLFVAWLLIWQQLP